MNFSTTQLNNVAIFCGLASMILGQFGISIGSDELQITVGMIIALVANIMQYVHRYKKGDINITGVRK